jgi:hypothetical protein
MVDSREEAATKKNKTTTIDTIITKTTTTNITISFGIESTRFIIRLAIS